MKRRDIGFLPAIAIVAASIGGGGCAAADREPSLVEAAIQGGHDDVIFDDTGRVANDIRQWARDASVSIEMGGTFVCSGTLVSPRVVLTNAHCVRFAGAPGAMTVTFGPQAGPGSVPPRTPSRVPVGVVACFTHPNSGAACGDGQPSEAGLNFDRDLAALVLQERIDVGRSGRRTTSYRALPAQIVPRDEACAGIEDPTCWDDHAVRHVGYSAINEDPSGPFPLWRQYASQHVSTGTLHIQGWTSSLELWGDHGVPGDSGGGVFLDVAEVGPQQLLAVHRQDLLADVAVRLTWGGTDSVQGWLASLLGPNPSYAGADVALPSGGTVWTGDVDLPPRTEALDRVQWGIENDVDPASVDSDGDGLVGSHDNCWGFYNPGQIGADATRLCCTNGGMPELRDACNELCPLPPSAPTPPATTTLTRDIDCDANNVPDVCDPDSDGDSRIDACDNCVGDRNASQADCNADAIAALNDQEAALGLPLTQVRGDACDSDPCGETRIIETSSTSSGPRLVSRRVAFDLVQVDARVASASTNARTGYRFCQCIRRTPASGDDPLLLASHVTDAPVSREDCEEPISIGNGGCDIHDNLDDYDRKAESRPWRWISMTPSASGGDAGSPGVEDVLTYDAPLGGTRFEIDRAGRWALIDKDIPRWTATFSGDSFDEFAAADGLRAAASGVFWTHTPGPGSGGLYASTARRRRSHYWSGQVAYPYDSIPILPRVMVLGPLARRGGWYGTLPFVVRVAEFNGFKAGPMLLSGNAGVPRTDTMALFEFDGTWVVASEPGELMADRGVRHVALGQTGELVIALAELDGQLVDADASECPDGKPCPGSAAFLAGRSPGEPIRGARFTDLDVSVPGAFVLSSQRQRLWRVSSSVEKGAAGTLATYDATSETWNVQQIPELGDVLAAVYSPREDAIWVLDQIASGDGRTARLHALGPDSGRVITVKAWERTTSSDRFAMAVDPEGRLYIAGGDASDHVIALIDAAPEKGVEVIGVDKQYGSIERGMIRASAAEVAFPIDRNGEQEIGIYSASHFLDGELDRNLAWLF